MKNYNHRQVENKWQTKWMESNLYKAEDKKPKKFYMLVELTYTSGDLHIGHWFAWSAPDTYARFKRMQGYNVLFPVGGFDAFGLPAENAAIKHEIHPREWTFKNIEIMRKQFAKMGPCFDWDKEVITADPGYYKWTQWLFSELYKKGLAYRGKVWSNWCPECKTVLANEHVENGCCWRHTGTPVEQKLVDQWLFKITDYADRLIWPPKPKVAWPQAAVEGQNNWIGKSTGLNISFKLKDSDIDIYVWTKFWETIFGATFLVLSPEHPLLEKVKISKRYKNQVDEYIKISKSKTERERKEEAKEKTGVFTGLFAINPANGKEIPIWIADYVLTDVGTAAVMGVPSHDARDFEFAKKYGLEIAPVVVPVRGYVDEKAKDYYIRRSKIHKELLVDLAKEAQVAGKKILVQGGWAVYLQAGCEFRDFEDLDLMILEDDLLWWEKILKDHGFGLSNMFPEGKNPKYYFQATKQDTHADITAIRIDKKGNVILLDSTSPESLNKPFDEVFDFKEIEGAPIFALNKDILYEWKKYNAKKKGLRWKEKADFMFMGFQSYEGEGTLINSGRFDGMDAWGGGKEKMAKWMIKGGFARWQTTYHLRDWSISRRRYWAAPVPIIYCKNCWEASDLPAGEASKLREGIDWAEIDGDKYMIRQVPEADLPVTLPENVDYTPTGKAPLATAKDWVKVACPFCGKAARREVETLDTYVDSSWYFLRYPDPKFKAGPFNPKTIKDWLPVKVYFGGPEHILGHTLYARFITKFLQDQGLLHFDEFAQTRRHHGVILGPDGYRMSKSRGNVVNPDEQVEKYGADSVRMYLMFIGPHEKGGTWELEGIEGMHRFLNRVWRLASLPKDSASFGESRNPLNIKMHQTIKKVTEDLENFKFNTAIAAIMEYVNVIQDTTDFASPGASSTFVGPPLKNLCLLLAPFAPYMAEEIWQKMVASSKKLAASKKKDQATSYKLPATFNSVHLQPWPKYDSNLIIKDQIDMVVQVDGRLRGQVSAISAGLSADKARIEKIARKEPKVAKWLVGKKIKKTIFVPGKLINFVLE